MAYITNPKKRGAENRKRIFKFFIDHPCHTNRDAAKKLDLSEMTVSKHARAIRAGWRPAPEVKTDG